MKCNSSSIPDPESQSLSLSQLNHLVLSILHQPINPLLDTIGTPCSRSVIPYPLLRCFHPGPRLSKPRDRLWRAVEARNFRLWEAPGFSSHGCDIAPDHLVHSLIPEYSIQDPLLHEPSLVIRNTAMVGVYFVSGCAPSLQDIAHGSASGLPCIPIRQTAGLLSGPVYDEKRKFPGIDPP